MSTATGFRAEWSTKQDFDIYEVFEDVLWGFAEYKFDGATVRGYDEHNVLVLSSTGEADVVSYPEALIEVLERLGVVEP